MCERLSQEINRQKISMQWKGNVEEEGLPEHANSTDAFISNPREKWEIKSIELQSPPVHEQPHYVLRDERWQ